MGRPPSTETQLRTARSDNRRLRDENLRLTIKSQGAEEHVRALYEELREARATIATLRKAVDALSEQAASTISKRASTGGAG